MADSKKRLALAIIDFLSTSLKDGTLTAEDSESIEIAQSCIAESFHVDPTDKAAVADALGGQNLLSIYGVYEKLKGKNTASTTGSSSAASAPSAASTATSSSTTGAAAGSGGSKEDAEKLKGQGNAAMQKKDYSSAIDLYTRALSIAPANPIYLSNRAAAYSATHQHELAKNDAEMATAADPSYTKAWSRLGLARFALGDAKGSMEAYKMGIEAEGNGGSDAMKRGYETAKRRVEEESLSPELDDDDDDNDEPATQRSAGGGGGGMPDLSSLAGMLSGMGGGAGGGGMPDIGALMQNPMMRQMAQNLMSNPDMMSNLMNNPQLRQMAGMFRGGGAGGAGAGAGAGAGEGAGDGAGAGAGRGRGGMPDLSSLLNDPNLAE
ncbi:hypothetical protein LTR04_006078, partial [Oleoguttula sp. CCFEE 6159]